jgi:Na+/H+ antiporter NhaA
MTRNVTAPLRDFLRTETGGAMLLLGAAVVALVWANSPWSRAYDSLWATTLSIHVGRAVISQDLRHWVNDGLMMLFFLVAGLEAKRELDVGQLRDRRRASVPIVAAVGGMVVPVAIYLAFNLGSSAARGWGAAMSTDTALMLGVLAVVAPGGTRLRVRLLTFALFDDLVALIVIATVYASRVSFVPLAVGIGLCGVLIALRHAPHAWHALAASLTALALWVALYESRIDPVIAGLVVGLLTNAEAPARDMLERVVDLTRSFREQPTPELARDAQRGLASALSANDRLQHRLHPWTSFVIVPLFALANAGIHVNGAVLGRAVSSPVTLGIFIGYVVGKPLGIFGSAELAVRWGLAPRALSSPVIAGGGVVAGVGFTVSLLISSLAFHGQALADAKVGILLAAAVSGLGAWIAFRVIARLPESVRARQVARTVEDIVDLADDVDPARDHVRGATDAPVTLVEYGDYECPHCGRAEPVVRDLLHSFGDELRYVWRHLPLSDVHPNAQLAAEAAEAAAAQGAFWEMHDKLIGHQNELAPRHLADYAKSVGLDTARFRDELLGHRYTERVADDVATADASGVVGTPTFFINGKRHHGAYNRAALASAVHAAQARAVSIKRHAADQAAR